MRIKARPSAGRSLPVMSERHPVPRADPPPAEPTSFLHGVGEVAGFFGAAGWAVVELALGRWPAPRPPRKRAAHGPYPAHD